MPISANSRFVVTPLVVDSNSPLRYTEWIPIRFGRMSEALYVVCQSDLNRPDLIAHKVYGVSELWWALLNYNGIIDPFSLEVGDKLRIPDRGELQALLADARVTRLRLQNAVIDTSPPALPLMLVPTLPHFERVLTPSEQDSLLSTGIAVLTNNIVFVYSFLVPQNLVGLVHFRVQFSADPDFSDITLTSFTLSSRSNWFFFNPNANNNTGGFSPFPPHGLDGILFSGQTVYLNLFSSDGLVSGTQYFARYETWVDNVEGSFVTTSPILF